MRGVRSTRSTCLCDPTQDIFQGVSDFAGGEAENAQATPGQYGIPFGIVLPLLVMYQAIYFHDDPRSVAVEVHNETVNNLLTAEFQAIEPSGTQMFPEDFLLGRHFATQFSGPLYFL